jgi:DNA-binding MurR/RpiR family transcriptional regulator
MLDLQAQNMQDGDLLLAISFHPYAPETLGVVQRASQSNISIIAITDTALSPLKATAAVCFEVEDAQVRGFRSLTATMCLAVSLVVGLGQHLEGQTASPEPKRGRRAKAGAA